MIKMFAIAQILEAAHKKSPRATIRIITQRIHVVKSRRQLPLMSALSEHVTPLLQIGNVTRDMLVNSAYDQMPPTAAESTSFAHCPARN
mmetsp:Transcript_37602/g.70228  ORF Transcript_37602/g.70228 Transcript_37602/m.70228 type:complete len:89 (+) Transcript_37602:3-269(+)